jgi:hypothetical protein
MTKSISINSQNTYEIEIIGQIDESWLDWPGTETVRKVTGKNQCPSTTLEGLRMDQAGLVGLIRQLHGMGVVLVSIRVVNG